MINGEARLARLIRFDNEEGLTTTQLAELLNVAESTIRNHIKKQAVCARSLSAHIKHTLKNSNIIPIKFHGGLFLSREGIEVLVKVINTDEAWEVYRQLWNDARELAALKPILAELQAKHDATLAEFNLVSAERDRYQSERDSVAQHAEELASINLKLLENLKTNDP